MVRGGVQDAATLLAQAKDKLGPASVNDDGWWKGNTRLGGSPTGVGRFDR